MQYPADRQTRSSDQASNRLDLTSAARALRGRRYGSSIICPGPGHRPGDQSLSVLLDVSAPEGFIVHSFAGDDPIVCRDYVRPHLGLPPRERGAQHPLRHARSTTDDVDTATREKTAVARRIWRQTADPRGTLAEKYLTSRNLTIDPASAGSVRFHDDLAFEQGRSPAMVGLFRDVATDEACGIHRTFLNAEGLKRGRKMLGRAKHAAIKLDPDVDVATALTIGEGIETSLSARQLGYGPVWALGSASAIEQFPVLPGIEVLTILAEHDESGANARAVQSCGDRWISAGREVLVVTPPVGDMNDAIRGRQ